MKKLKRFLLALLSILTIAYGITTLSACLGDTEENLNGIISSSSLDQNSNDNALSTTDSSRVSGDSSNLIESSLNSVDSSTSDNSSNISSSSDEGLNSSSVNTQTPVDSSLLHLHVYTAEETTSATCTEGVMTYTCSCNDRYTEIIEELEHTGGTATCTTKAVCTGCQEEYGDVLGHTGGTATCELQATCTRCGEKYGGLAAHIYENKKCTVCEDTLKTSEGLEFSWIESEQGYYLTGIGTCTDTDIVIDTYNGKPILSVFDIFRNSNLTSVIIGDSVEYISSGAFFDSKNLTSVVIGEGTTEIGGGAFSGCTNLQKVVIGNNVRKIAEQAFKDCTSLKEVYIEDVKNWYEIQFEDYMANPLNCGGALYEDNQLVTSIVVPNGITEIKRYAFFGCTSLRNIEIGNDVTHIFYNAFYNCSNLTNVIIGKNVTHIYSVFQNCENLESMTLPFVGASRTSFEDSMKDNDIFGYIFGTGTTDSRYGYNKGVPQSLKEVIITDAITIPNLAFKNCGYIKKVLLANGVTSIGNYAFENCSRLKSMVIPNSVTSIGNYAFLHSGVDSIVIPNSVTSIGVAAFSNCNSLESIEIPNSVTSIGSSAFRDCRKLINITLSENLKEIGWQAFANTGYYNNENNWENNLLYIGKYLIVANIYLNGKCIVKEGTKYIANGTFRNCAAMTEVLIPEGVTELGDSVFQECSALKSVIIPASVTKVDDWAFWKCEKLEKVYYKGTQESWNEIAVSDYYNGNDCLNEATLYYYNQSEPALNMDGTAYDGNWWHYDADAITPVVWQKEE